MTNDEKKELVKAITTILAGFNIGHRNIDLGNIIKVMEKKGVPTGQAADIVYLKTDLINEPEFILYCVCSGITNSNGCAINSAAYGVIMRNIGYLSNKYANQTLQAKKFQFPLKYKMVQVIENTMWIGTITIKDLMKLRDAQIVYYNENTQRKLRHVVDKTNNIEYYTIDIKQSSIDSIQELMLQGRYIPDALVLNMCEQADYYYDAKNAQLVITDIPHFDIIDGYHRYRAISNLYQKNKEFDYVMQLQIVNYSESMAQQFMWQKDQQTKLRKLDSVTLNQSNAGTQIANRLNADSGCNLYEHILRNGGIVNAVELSNIITVVYFNNARTVKQEMKEVIRVSKEIKEIINMITESNTDTLTTPWTYMDELMLVFQAYTYNTDQGKNFDMNVQTVRNADEFKYLEKQRSIGKREATRIAKALEVKLRYV